MSGHTKDTFIQEVMGQKVASATAKATGEPKRVNFTLPESPASESSLIGDMAAKLSGWEEAAWDGDPRRRSADKYCQETLKLVSRAKEFLAENGKEIRHG